MLSVLVGLCIGVSIEMARQSRWEAAVGGVERRIDDLEEKLFQCEGALGACVEGELLLLDRMKECSP